MEEHNEDWALVEIKSLRQFTQSTVQIPDMDDVDVNSDKTLRKMKIIKEKQVDKTHIINSTKLISLFQCFYLTAFKFSYFLANM